MPVPSVYGNFNYREQNAHGRHKPLCPLPIPFVPFKPVFQVCNATTVAVPRQIRHLRFQDTQIAKHLCLEFIHHPHSPDSILF
jgi:hypothetical protein